jgi:hypothetical protein
MRPEEDILRKRKGSLETTYKVLKKHGFIVLTGDYEQGFPLISIKSTPESLILMTRRLQDMLAERFVMIKSNQENLWVPQVQAVFDPAANQAVIYIYGIDDDLLPDL